MRSPIEDTARMWPGGPQRGSWRDDAMAEIWRADIFPGVDVVTRAVLLHDFDSPSLFTALDWERAWMAICANGLAAVALRMIRESGASVPDAVLQELTSSQFLTAARSLAISVASRDALDRLAAAGIQFVITKGPGIAACSPYRHERPFSDLDVVVSRSQFDRARHLLASLGYEESCSSRQSWAVLDTVAREAVNLRDGRGGSIDLHHHIPPWLWGQALTFDRLQESAVSIAAETASLRCASTEVNFMVVALHLVSDRNRPGATLMIWRDLLVLARDCEPDVLRHLADDVGLTGWVQWVLTRFPAQIYERHLSALLGDRRRPETIPAAHRLRLLLPPHLGSRHLISQPLRLPAWRGALYCLGGLLPSRAFLRAQGLEADGGRRYLTWWRRGVTKIWMALRPRADQRA